jgi:Flp pilus assembly protein TadD
VQAAAVALQPALDRAWYGLGLSLIRQDRLEDATGAFERNTRLQPFNPYGWYHLGMTHHHLGRSAEAHRVYQTLRAFEPRYAATLQRDLQTTPRRGKPGAAEETPCS